MGYEAAAVYDAVVAIEGGYQPYAYRPRTAAERSAAAGASTDAAIIEAAYRVLRFYFPSQAATLDTCHHEALATLIGGSATLDGVAIGGSLGKSKSEMHSVIDWTRPHLPSAWPRHLLGIGEPEDLLACVELGIDQFDCVAPTRLGRHGQLYTSDGRLHITHPDLKDDPRPIQEGCGCYTCRTGFSRGYIRHLFAAHELLGYTLTSLHNLYFILDLMRQIRIAIREDRLADLEAAFLPRYSGNPGAAREAPRGTAT